MKKRRKLKKNVCLCIFIVVFIILILIIYKELIISKPKIVGVWTTDDVTIYEFYKNNTGKLIVSLNEYEFNYKLKDNYLYVDFINDKSDDSEYYYSLKNNKLILKNDNGTFIFIRKDT